MHFDIDDADRMMQLARHDPIAPPGRLAVDSRARQVDGAS
jgi:hypothetical protein